MASRGPRPAELTFEQIAGFIAGCAPGKPLPVAVLCVRLEAEPPQEVRVLTHLVRCRANGFMGLVPALAEVADALGVLVDGAGQSLLVTKDVRLPIEDSRGKRFGEADLWLVDFAADCAASFIRGPAVRGSKAGGDIIRLRIGEVVARPSSQAAWSASNDWIAEMAEDDSMNEYLTAAEEVAEGMSEPEADQQADLVAQLQARIVELEAAQASPQVHQQAAPAPLAFKPKTRGLQPTQLFDPQQTATVLDPSTVMKLKSLAGPPPSRLAALEANPRKAATTKNPTPVPTPAQNAYAEIDLEATQEDELGQLAAGSTDPLHRILLLQMQQTNALVQRLVKPPQDPLTGALASEPGSSSSNGVKGCVAREAYIKTCEDVVGMGRIIMQNAAADLGLTSSQIDSGLMRLYVEKRIPLGDWKVLTYFAQFLACAWQAAFEHQDELALGLTGQGLMMVEQMCLDAGRCQFAWLLTSMTEPNFGQIQMNLKRTGLKPYAKLAAAPWVAANIAYLKDLDFLENRLRNAKGGGQTEDPPEKDDPKPRRRGKFQKKQEGGDSTTAS